MMKKLTYLLLLVSIQFYGQGLKLTPKEELKTFTKLPADKYGFATILPFASSLEKYVPPVRTQEGGTCVGFASFYYGLSTMYNERLNLQTDDEKHIHSFDPYFIYSIIFNGTEDCDSGLYFSDAFEKLKNIGAKKLLYPPFTNCQTEWSNDKLKNTIQYTTPYSINEWYILNLEHPDLLNIIKEQIYSEKIPVIAGFDFIESMYDVKENGLWTPADSEEVDGGHALCVVGYDDYKFGGAFRIVNSWGADFGDGGFMWVKYADFQKYVYAAYVMELNNNVKTTPPTAIETANYRRYGYSTDKNNMSFYEGQYLNDGINGYGIWTDSDDSAFYVGQFDDGEMNGYFLLLDEDGFYSANAVNGTLQDFEKLGFAADQTLMNTQLEAKKYFSKLGVSLSLRKANSTKKSASKLSKDE
ncbi:C1 family peptidase [Flavobacteriaceae bacterium]|nr:C1 family peptidase [Flavobacteriaceae bacterium]